MRAEDILALPPRAPSEVEWEDLLVRLELMPRALSVVTGEIDLRTPAFHAVAAALVERERRVAGYLQRAAGLPAAAPPSEAQPLNRQADVLDRFVRLRARNFAIVQRRGLDVQEWRVTLEEGGEATVYQVLTCLAGEDVATLAALRGQRSSGPSGC
jgi:hypothetical protein